MRVRRFEAGDSSGIARLNARLADGGADWTVWPEGAEQRAGPLRARLFVADDGAGEIRGAAWIHEHEFWYRGEAIDAGWAKYPVAESLISPQYAGVAAALLVKLTREQPRLMALGMGGTGGQFARLLASMRWTGENLPFLIKVLRPTRVLRRLPALRRSPSRAVLADALALSGLGELGGRAVVGLLAAGAPSSQGLALEEVTHFEGWADEIWERSRGQHTFIARRDAAMLNGMYPASMPVRRFRVRRDGAVIGWVVTLFRDLAYARPTAFGPLRVGMLVDGLGLIADVPTLVRASLDALAADRPDVVFSNQADVRWIAALRQNGFVSGPSQFAFSASPKMADLLRDPSVRLHMHMNRGDCDGPMFA